MTLKSMTGFARATGQAPPLRWTWEIKAVNAKGLDARLRLAPGFESIEIAARARVAKALARGSVYLNLSAQRDSGAERVKINVAAARALIESLRGLNAPDLGPLTLDGLLAAPGVVEMADQQDIDRASLDEKVVASLDEALVALGEARRQEGAALENVLRARLDRIARLIDAARNAPGRRPEAIREKLAKLIAELSNHSTALDPARLHQEAILLAAKADVTEEIDRLRTHEGAARALLSASEPVGRRLDFLAQELAREANTLCAKSNDAALTRIGIDLRVEIEQFREQVQNIE
jgi:uncharacterized protein (TIGR00255 family)